MARSCGLRIGPRRFEFVILDGSPKKHRIIGYHAGDFDVDEDGEMNGAAKALGQALQSHSIPHDNVGLVIDSAQAAFRRMSLPFTDRAKIDQVIKFEVESELPQWNIDDVIVDFHVLSENEDSCEVLVTAVPKEGMQGTIDVAEKAGIEPLEAEIEATAMINAAMGADLCHLDDAQVLVHVGERSTSVAVIDAGELREMRVIHIGALTHEMTTADAPAPTETGEDGEAAVVEAPAQIAIDPAAAARRTEQAVKRIRRELGRTMSAVRTIHPIEAIYVCGMDLDGLVGESILDTPVYVLDCFDADGGQPADGYGQLVVAYGSALRQLGGGVLAPSLRREELRYTGTWERVEYPLAVAAMLLFFVLFFSWFLLGQQTEYLNGNVSWWTTSLNQHLIPDVVPGHLYPPSEDTKFVEEFKAKYAEGDYKLTDDLVANLEELERQLGDAVIALGDQAGNSGGKMPQSVFQAANLVLGIVESHKTDWRLSIRKLTGTYQHSNRQGKPSTVKITLDAVFLDDDVIGATNDYEDFNRELSNMPWVVEIQTKNSEELVDGSGISVLGIPIIINLDLLNS
jgi:hypothetical protein